MSSITWEPWLSLVEMIGAMYFKVDSFQELETPQDWWSKIIFEYVALAKSGQLVKGIRKKDHGKYDVDLAIKEIPESLIRASALYGRLVEMCRDLERLNIQLGQNVANKTDLVQELLMRFDQ